MLRSRLPVPSLLGLFGAFLMLFPELLMGIPEGLSDAPLANPAVMKSLSPIMDQYNKNQGESDNYFKVLRIAQKQTGMEHHLLLELAETTCKKKPGGQIPYQNVMKCKLRPENSKKRICYLKVLFNPLRFKLHLDVTLCF